MNGSTIFLVACLVVAPVTAKLGDYVKICDVKDPKYNECAKNAAQEIFISLTKGIKEYGIPPVEPLGVPQLTIDQGVGPVGLVLTLKNSKHYGLSSIEFKSARVDPKNYHLQLNATFPQYSVVGDYDVKGRILLLPITGEGPSNLTMSGINVGFTIDGKPVTRNGKDYMDLTQFRVHIAPERTYIQLDNLFNGNQALSDTMNRFLNENHREVSNELMPSIEEAFSQLYLGLASRLFSKVPFKEIFPNA